MDKIQDEILKLVSGKDKKKIKDLLVKYESAIVEEKAKDDEKSPAPEADADNQPSGNKKEESKTKNVDQECSADQGESGCSKPDDGDKPADDSSDLKAGSKEPREKSEGCENEENNGPSFKEEYCKEFLAADGCGKQTQNSCCPKREDTCRDRNRQAREKEQRENQDKKNGCQTSKDERNYCKTEGDRRKERCPEHRERSRECQAEAKCSAPSVKPSTEDFCAFFKKEFCCECQKRRNSEKDGAACQRKEKRENGECKDSECDKCANRRSSNNANGDEEGSQKEEKDQGEDVARGNSKHEDLSYTRSEVEKIKAQLSCLQKEIDKIKDYISNRREGKNKCATYVTKQHFHCNLAELLPHFGGIKELMTRLRNRLECRARDGVAGPNCNTDFEQLKQKLCAINVEMERMQWEKKREQQRRGCEERCR